MESLKGVNRADLARFITDQKTLIAFENIIAFVNALSETTLDDISNSAVNGESRANSALDILQGLKESVDVIAMAPIPISNEFDPAKNEIITGQWSFDISTGKYFLATDDTTLVAPTVLFGAGNHAPFAATSIIGRSLYSDGAKTCGSYWDYNDDTSANFVLGIAANASGSASDSMSLTVGGLTKRTMTHTVIKSLFTPYANLAAINAAIVAPENDMFVMVNGQGLARYNGAWVLASDDTTAVV